MGYRLAEAARDRGATVTLVSGPTALAPPAGVELVPVRSAEEMARAVSSHAARVDVVAMAAAVSDYRPASVSDVKVKKSDGAVSLEMVRTPDILRGLGQAKGAPVPGRVRGGDGPAARARAEEAAREERRPAGRERRREGRHRLRRGHQRRGADRRGRRDRGAAHEQARAGRADLGPCRREIARAQGDGVTSDERAELLADLAERARYFATLTDIGLPAAGKREGPVTVVSQRIETTSRVGSGAAGQPPGPAVETLEAIRADLGDCQRCLLARSRMNIVFGQGNPQARLMFVGRGAGSATRTSRGWRSSGRRASSSRRSSRPSACGATTCSSRTC